MPAALQLDQLRCHAVAQPLFAPTTLAQAIGRLGFVQADPIRVPARAQDLTLRHRVKSYRVGDLQARYVRIDVEERLCVKCGLWPRATLALMHPRSGRAACAGGPPPTGRCRAGLCAPARRGATA